MLYLCAMDVMWSHTGGPPILQLESCLAPAVYADNVLHCWFVSQKYRSAANNPILCFDPIRWHSILYCAALVLLNRMESSGAEIEEFEQKRREEKRREEKWRETPISVYSHWSALFETQRGDGMPQQQRKETVDAYIYCVRETRQPKRETKMGERL